MMINKNNVMNHVRKIPTALAIAVGLNVGGFALFNKLNGTHIKSAPEYVYDMAAKEVGKVAKEIDTYKAIKAEGIQAKTYAEAKMKLDSIRLDRVCKEAGLPVPQKPAQNASWKEKSDYNKALTDIYVAATLKALDKSAASAK